MWKSALILTILLGFSVAVEPAPIESGGPPVKMSRSGICHERGTSHYLRTVYFDPYASMQACLDAGGRRSNATPTRSASETKSGISKVLEWLMNPPDWTWFLIGLVGALWLSWPYISGWRHRRQLVRYELQARKRWKDHRLEPKDPDKPR